MALIKCHECGNDVSTEAAACPKCGAKPKKPQNKTPVWQKIFIVLIFGFGLISWIELASNSTNTPIQNIQSDAGSASGEDQEHTQKEAVQTPTNSNTPRNDDPKRQEEPQVDFNLATVTKQYALICPINVIFDRREGHSLKDAVKAHISIFGHDEAIEKSGCQEWQEGITVNLSDEAKKHAIELQAKGMCGMVDFSEGLVFSCSLKNQPADNTQNSST